MSPAQLTNAVWRTSSRSNGNGDCVEVGRSEVAVGVRDSKDPGGGLLAISPGTWTTFLSAVKSGAHDPARALV